MVTLNDAIFTVCNEMSNVPMSNVPTVVSQIQEFKEFHKTYESMIPESGATGYMDRLIRHTNIENANMLDSCDKCIHNILTKQTKKVTFDKKYGQQTNWGNIKIPAQGDPGLDNLLPRPHSHQHEQSLTSPTLCRHEGGSTTSHQCRGTHDSTRSP